MQKVKCGRCVFADQGSPFSGMAGRGRQVGRRQDAIQLIYGVLLRIDEVGQLDGNGSAW